MPLPNDLSRSLVAQLPPRPLAVDIGGMIRLSPQRDRWLAGLHRT
jgi:hypothetical protein